VPLSPTLPVRLPPTPRFSRTVTCFVAQAPPCFPRSRDRSWDYCAENFYLVLHREAAISLHFGAPGTDCKLISCLLFELERVAPPNVATSVLTNFFFLSKRNNRFGPPGRTPPFFPPPFHRLSSRCFLRFRQRRPCFHRLLSGGLQKHCSNPPPPRFAAVSVLIFAGV